MINYVPKIPKQMTKDKFKKYMSEVDLSKFIIVKKVENGVLVKAVYDRTKNEYVEKEDAREVLNKLTNQEKIIITNEAPNNEEFNEIIEKMAAKNKENADIINEALKEIETLKKNAEAKDKAEAEKLLEDNNSNNKEIKKEVNNG